MEDTAEYFIGEKEDLPRRIDGEHEQPAMVPEGGRMTGAETHRDS